MVPKISSGLGAQAKTPDTVQLKQSATSILKAIRPVSASVPSFSGQKESAKMPTSNDNMSNDIGAITQQQEYSYPPLGELGMNDAVQPYGNLQEERDFPHIDDERNPFENDQQQPQQEQQESMEAGTRYEQVPSPPGGTAYHNERALAFQAQTAQLVNELTNALQGIHRTGSDGESRSKPVPKPDRPVTKDTDGRFVCNWQGCDEPVKHFNRKCEWS